jgi:hypothetical protein
MKNINSRSGRSGGPSATVLGHVLDHFFYWCALHGFGCQMRPLTEDESKAVFTKLANYVVRLPTCLPASICGLTFTGQEPGPLN